MRTRAADHPWSSHAAALGAAPAPPWLTTARLFELLDHGDSSPYAALVNAFGVISGAGLDVVSPADPVGLRA